MTPRSWVPNVPISTERDMNNIRQVTTTNNYLWRCFTLVAHPTPESDAAPAYPLFSSRPDGCCACRFDLLHTALCAFNPSNRGFPTLYNCLVEIELHREIYHFTHERQPLKPDSNQHTRYTAVLPIEQLSDEV